jgi:hypothetical protein
MPVAKQNIIGLRFGILTVTRAAPSHKRPNGKTVTRVEVKCDCGSAAKIVRAYHIKSGHTTNCGCLSKYEAHGDAANGFSAAEYISWTAMKRRCSDPSHENYQRYGGRGVVVCDSWLKSYRNFLTDMGRKPTPDHTIDRIDSDGNYEPKNCRWATRTEQEQNKKKKPAPIKERAV